MTEPTQRSVRETESNRFDIDMPQPPLVPETEAERAARQPLFNKKKMVFWAMLTLAIYITVSRIVPIAVQSAKEAIREASRPGVNPEVRTIVLPNGRRITITKTGGGVTINETRPGEATAAPIVPAKPPEPPNPAVPAPEAKK